MKPNPNRIKHLKNALGCGLLLAVLGASLSGCYEQRYYNRYHHHTRPWYDHHHQAPPPGVRFDVDVR